MYNGVRGHYAIEHGRVFPILGRRGVSVSAMSGIDLALWGLLGKERFEVRDRMIEIPERPGLGVTIDEAFVERYAIG